MSDAPLTIYDDHNDWPLVHVSVFKGRVHIEIAGTDEGATTLLSPKRARLLARALRVTAQCAEGTRAS